MCKGPHEMTKSELQDNIEFMRDMIAGEQNGNIKHYWEGELEMYEQLLKDIENGEVEEFQGFDGTNNAKSRTGARQ